MIAWRALHHALLEFTKSGRMRTDGAAAEGEPETDREIEKLRAVE